MADRPSVAVIGTGIMGGAMASRWAGEGFPVTVWNRDRTKAERVAERGALVADSPADAVAGADFVVTMLADGTVTEAVMADAVGSINPDSVWVQMGTVGIEATERLAAMASQAGVAFVDAPVSGTKGPAEQGKLAVFASGPEELQERCRPLFDVVASKVTWVGDTGAGSRMKLVVNAWLAALLAGLAECVALAEHIGVDPAQFLAAIDGGPLGPAYAKLKGEMMLERSYPVSFPLRLLRKDVDLVADAAAASGAELRLPAAIHDLLVAAETAHGDDDMSAIVEALRGGPGR